MKGNKRNAYWPSLLRAALTHASSEGHSQVLNLLRAVIANTQKP